VSSEAFLETSNLSELGISIYPNPIQDVLNIKTEVPILLQIFNTNGLLVKELEILTGEQSIVVEHLNSGLYISKVVALTGKWTNQHSISKIIKQ
jgi:hypothetical protein